MSPIASIKEKVIRNRLKSIIPYSLFLLLLVGCKNDMQKVSFFDRKTLPTQSITNGVVTRSSYGLLQMRLEAPVIESYDGPQSRTVYPKGVYVRFYEGGSQLKASVQARYGISLDSRQLMEIKDSVVIIDYRSGDTSYLENLVWDQNLQTIYSNRPIRSVNGQRITLGDGFVSDENFEYPRILHQRGTIEWADE